MKQIIFLSAVLVCASLSVAKDLQDILDAAAASPEKVAEIRGEYFLKKPLVLTNKHSGLKIVGYGNALVSGGVRVKNWREEGKFFVADCDAEIVEALWVEGKRARVAQSEEICYFYSSFLAFTGKSGKKPRDPNRRAFMARNEDVKALESLPEEELKDAYVDVYKAWIHLKCPIEGIGKNSDGKTSTLLVGNRLMIPFYQFDFSPRFRVCNVKSLLDKAGEFYFSKKEKKIYYLPHDGEKAETIVAYIPKLTHVLEIRGESFENPVEVIKISGVKFAHGGHFPHDKWRQGFQAAATNDAFIRIANAKNVEISNCYIKNVNGYGIAFDEGVSDSVLQKSVVRDAGSGGVKVGFAGPTNFAENKHTSGIVIKNNIICGYGRYDYAGSGIIIFNCGNNRIEGNAIFDGYYSGITAGWIWTFTPTLTQNNIITGNKIFEIGHGILCDLGGIYTLGESSGSELSYNEIYNVRRHRYGGWGIYNDAASQNWKIFKNYVHDTQDDTYFQNFGRNNEIKNNIFENGVTSQFGLERQTKSYRNSFRYEQNVVVYSSPAILIRNNTKIQPQIATINKNLYWNKTGSVKFAGLCIDQWRKLGQDADSVIEDPKLENLNFKSDAYKKIGFEKFEIPPVCGGGEMEELFNKIVAEHDFPPNVSLPPDAPWDMELNEDLSLQGVGKTPRHMRVDSRKGGKDVLVMEEGGKRFIRYTDSPSPNREFMPTGYYSARVGGDEVCVEFNFRVNETSTFFVEARGENCENDGPNFSVHKGTTMSENGRVELPKDRWLKFKGVFKMGADAKKIWSYEISDDGKKVLTNTAKYAKGPILRMSMLVVASMSDTDGDTFDITEVKSTHYKQ